MAPTAAPTYVSSTGSLGERPLAVRVTDAVGNYGTIAYLFFETLFSPFINPGSWANPAQTTAGRPGNADGGRSGSGGGSGGSGGGGGGSGGGRGGGGGGGFMSMSQMRGGGTVDGCRATCG